MVEWTTYLFFWPVRLTSPKTHPAHGNPHPGSMPPVNRGYVPGLSFPPRALAAARLGEGRMWKGFWPKTYGSLCLPGIYCRPLLSKKAF